MKFGRVLRDSAECSPDLPELQALFQLYKQLKKQIKRMPAPSTGGVLEDEFVASLAAVVARLNDIFLEKEEASVIRLERLQSALAGAGAARDAGRSDVGCLEALHHEFVDFHGEVLLLVHWSILAYTATVKLLKKHHKRTGLLLRAPVGNPGFRNLLSQPFCSTEVMTGIAHRVEADIAALCRLASQTSVDATDLRAMLGSGSDDQDDQGGAGAAGTGEEEAGGAAAWQEPPAADPLPRLAAEGEEAAAQPLPQAAPRDFNEERLLEGRDPRGASVTSSGRSSGNAVTEVCGGPRATKRPRLAKNVPCADAGNPALASPAGALSTDQPARCCPSGGCGPPPLARPQPGDILRQARAALQTWEQLIASASTPSTVMAELPAAKARTNTTESSAA